MKMIHPDTQLKWISEAVGYGVVATKLIPKGTITWVQDALDSIFEPDAPLGMNELEQEMLEKYSFRNSRGEHVLCWDFGKFVNHSFRSNCLSTAYNFELAVRDIQPGEELTDDYGYLNLSESFQPIDEGTARKLVMPDDILQHYTEWDHALRKVFPEILKIDQPLWSLLEEKLVLEISEVAAGKRKMLSTRNLYYEPEKSRI